MKAIILSVLVISLLIGAQSVYAKSAFITGFNYGVQDARTPPNSPHGFPPGPIYNGTYINQTGKGLDHHSTAFGEGYIRGWCEVRQNATLYPNAHSWAPDIRCRDTLGLSIIFSN